MRKGSRRRQEFYPSGLAYIIVPSDIDRSQYIATCMSTETVSIFTEEGGVFHDIKIPPSILSQITFPDGKKESLGSGVIYVSHPKQGIPIIVQYLSKGDESRLLQYKEFRLHQSLGENQALISGRGDTGDIIVSTKSATKRGGNILISINKADNSGLITLDIQGDGVFNMKNLKIDLSEFLSINNTQTDIFSSKAINLGKNSLEWGVLGETLDEQLSALVDIISSAKTLTQMGPQPFMGDTQAKLTKWKSDIKQNLSNLVKIGKVN